MSYFEEKPGRRSAAKLLARDYHAREQRFFSELADKVPGPVGADLAGQEKDIRRLVIVDHRHNCGSYCEPAVRARPHKRL